jgi:hypothetical protein
MFALTLLGFLSYNHLKHAQNNTVFLTQEKMDRVGLNPRPHLSVAFVRIATDKGELIYNR